MERLACVNLFELPLQLLLHRHPDWKKLPIAVLDRDTSQGLLQAVNWRALKLGVRRGQRYGAALSLCASLRAGEVSTTEVNESLEQCSEILQKFTPTVEPCGDEPGLFWLDSSGLHRLYPSLQNWAEKIIAALRTIHFEAAMVVGFGRFATYALSKASRRTVVINDRDQETRAMRQVPLARIGFEPEVSALFEKLAVRAVGDFVALPGAGIRRRFGERAYRLHRLAAGDLELPMSPVAASERYERSVDFDEPDSHCESLLFRIKHELDHLLQKLAERGRALRALTLVFTLEKHPARHELVEGFQQKIEPAEATLDGVQLLHLVRLRMESMSLVAGVVRIELFATAVRASATQLQLFAEKPRRDLKSANRALARIVALWGNRSVVRAQLREGHLPEAQLSWEPTSEVLAPKPRARIGPRSLVRRLSARPIALSYDPSTLRPAQGSGRVVRSGSKRNPDGWLPLGAVHGPVEHALGPYSISGGWWQQEVARDYYFVELRSGAMHWIYYDRQRSRWFWHGQVG